IDEVLKNIFNILKINGSVVFSIPFIGDPNLEADPTHIIKETKEWWINKIKNAGFDIIPTPEHFLFKEQMIIGAKK
ncbi:MAG: hypothetical protein AABY22_34155, partial [Nanoarchaeota archaeon]